MNNSHTLLAKQMSIKGGTKTDHEQFTHSKFFAATKKHRLLMHAENSANINVMCYVQEISRKTYRDCKSIYMTF